MFKNVATKIALFAFDTTTGAAKTGDAANLTAYVSKDFGSVTVLADTSATEMDATNAKGWYLFDLAQGETNADACLFSGKSTTSNISVVGQLIFTTPANFSSLSVDSSGRVDAIKLASQTITAAAGVTFPSSVASPTNITAGTITTVTNLTNAPTAGDLTATMKASVTTAATSATPTVTVGTNSDKTGYALTSAYDYAKGTVAMTEAYAANGAAPTPVQALFALHQMLMQFAISSTSYTVKKLDNSTTAFVVTLNDATTPTSAVRT